MAEEGEERRGVEEGGEGRKGEERRGKGGEDSKGGLALKKIR